MKILIKVQNLLRHTIFLLWSHLKVSSNIECNCSRGMNHVEDGEVKTKRQHPRGENDDKGRPGWLLSVKPIYNPITFKKYCRYSKYHSCKGRHVVNCVYAKKCNQKINEKKKKSDWSCGENLANFSKCILSFPKLTKMYN